MSQPYIGEIRMFGGNFAPVGWASCDGQLIAISQNDTLFNLIGTTYGGDGQNTFALPDLRGRLPIHQGGGHVIGEMSGAENVALTVSQMPNHAHHVQGTTSTATSKSPAGNMLATSVRTIYGLGGLVSTHPASVSTAGSGLSHNNVQPFLAVTFIISLFGVYPSQT